MKHNIFKTIAAFFVAEDIKNSLTGFEECLAYAFGKQIQHDEEFAKRAYAALTNIIWRNGEKEYSVTFRYAGGLIADIRGDGSNYMTWYCSASEGVVDKSISKKLAEYGWTHHEHKL